jgi:hypothetical protein
MKNTSFKSAFIFASLLLLLILFSIQNADAQGSKTDSLQNGFQKDIRQLVKENSLAANRWWYTWFVGYSAATVVQSGIALTSPELKTKQDMWNGAATTFLGMAGLLVTPLVPKKSEVEKIVTEGMETGHIYTDADFYRAALKDIARREKFERSWKVHVVTGIVNAGSGLVTWLGFNRTLTDGLVTFAINTAVTETQIWTQPIRAVRDYENYTKAQKNGKLAGPVIPSKQWFVSATPGGVSLRLKF